MPSIFFSIVNRRREKKKEREKIEGRIDTGDVRSIVTSSKEEKIEESLRRETTLT